MNDQASEENVHVEMPKWDAETREGIAKTAGSKKDMLPRGAFGKYPCRLTRLKGTRGSAFVAEAVLTADPIATSAHEVAPGEELAYSKGDTISFYLLVTLGKPGNDGAAFQQRKQNKLLADFGMALFKQDGTDPNFDPFVALEKLMAQGRLDDATSGMCTFVWERSKGNPKSTAKKKRWIEVDGQPVEDKGHYSDDSVYAP